MPTDSLPSSPQVRDGAGPCLPLQWFAIGAAYLGAFSLCFVALSSWKTTQSLIESRDQSAAELRSFHIDLVRSIQTLSEKAGYLTSADLAPVRFRLRDAAGDPPGTMQYSALLERLETNSHAAAPLYEQSAVASGVLDFGLLSPGKYRLRLSSRDGMSCEHEFTTLPGVPIDRLVYVPRQVDARLSQGRAWIETPSLTPHSDVIAVIQVVPTDFECEGWCWTLSEPRVRVERVCGTSEDQLQYGWHASWPMVAKFVDSGVENPSESALRDLPYRYFEVTRIKWLVRTRPGNDSERLQVAGEVCFRGGGREGDECDFPSWRLDSPPPRFETALARVEPLHIQLPDEVGRLIQQNIAEMVTPSAAAAALSSCETAPPAGGAALSVELDADNQSAPQPVSNRADG